MHGDFLKIFSDCYECQSAGGCWGDNEELVWHAGKVDVGKGGES